MSELSKRGLKDGHGVHQDPHAPYLKELAGAGNWAALVRYWLAHQHDPALEEAISLLRRCVLAGESRWQPLVTYLEAFQAAPLDPRHQAPEANLPHLNEAQTLTLRLLFLYPRAILCEHLPPAPPEHQAGLRQLGIEAADKGAQAGMAAGDRAAAAFFLGMLARGFHQVGQTKASMQAWSVALQLYRELAPSRPEVYRPYMAVALDSLGSVRRDLNDLEAAQASYAEALSIRRELACQQPAVAGPVVVATLNNLGNLQRALNEPDAARASHIEALAICRERATHRSEVHLSDLAATLNNLGLDQYAALEFKAARASYEEALTIRQELAQQRPDRYQPDLAATLNNLGNLQRALNELEAARANLEAALAIYRDLAPGGPEVFRPRVALALNNLGLVRSELNDLPAARIDLEEALGIFRELAQTQPEAYGHSLALALTNLGNVQRAMNALKPARSSLDAALAVARELASARPAVYRPYLALTLNNLGTAQADLNELAAARVSFEEGLKTYRELAQTGAPAFRLGVAMTLNNLGMVQRDLNDLEAAQASYEEATRLYEGDIAHQADPFLGDRQRAHADFARLLRREDARLGWPDYRTARQHLEVACQCAERFRGKFRDQRERRRLLAEAHATFELHVRNSVDVWDVSLKAGRSDAGALRQAVWAAEASRSRQLLDKLAQAESRPVLAPPALQAEYARLQEQLERTCLRLEREEPGSETTGGSDGGTRGLAGVTPVSQVGGTPVSRSRGSTRGELLKLLQQQEQEMDTLLDRIRPHDSEFDPKRGGRAVGCEAIEALIPPEPRTAFVQYALGREQSIAFVLLGQGTGDIRPVPLPQLRAEAMERLRAKWFEAYGRWRGKRLPPEALVREWEIQMQPVLAEVSSAALAPVLTALPEGVQRLVISPHQSLHVFPLHACRLGGDTPLGDQFEVVYTPSFSVLHRCAQRRPEAGGSALLVECPDGVSAQPLPFARVECAALRRRLGRVRRIVGQQATAEVVASAGRECGLLHYSGHAAFDPETPLRSKLMLTGEPLTLGQVFGGVRLPRNRLVVLSGCESGLIVPDVLDDYVSFTTGFLYAGAPCAVSALWEIPDLPSALLMDRFCELWLGGVPAAAALRAAQRWLRCMRAGPKLDRALEALTENLDDPTEARRCRATAARYVAELGEHPFACPLHWAAFTCSGVGYGQPSSPESQAGQPPERNAT